MVGGVCTYPEEEEEDWVAVAEAVTVADVKTTTVEEVDTPVAKVVGVEDEDVCCGCATVSGDEVGGAAEVGPADEGVLWRSVS